MDTLVTPRFTVTEDRALRIRQLAPELITALQATLGSSTTTVVIELSTLAMGLKTFRRKLNQLSPTAIGKVVGGEHGTIAAWLEPRQRSRRRAAPAPTP